MHRRLTRPLILAIAVALALPSTGCSRRARANRHLDVANAAFTAGRYDEAEIEYKNVVQLSGFNPVAIGRLGIMYMDEGRPGQSLPFLLKARDLDPKNADIRLKLGLAQLAVSNLAAAHQEALAALDLRPTDVDAPLLLAESCRTAQEAEATRRKLLSLPKGASTGAPVLVALAQLEMRVTRTAPAEKYFMQALAADPKSANAHAGLALIAWSRKELTRAEAEFKASADNCPPRSARKLQYAQFKLQNGDLDGARRLLDEMIQQTPDYIPGWLWRAEIALGEKKLDDADKYATTALTRDGMHPEALLLNARVSLARGDTSKAIMVLERMVSIYPQSAVAFYQLGVAYSAKGDAARARDNLTRATTLAPDLAPAVIALADLNIRTGDYNAAVAALRPLNQKNPDAAPVRLLLAEAYRGQGNLDSALALNQQTEKQFPENPQTPFLRGLILRQQGRTAEAKAAFARAFEVAGNFAALEQLVDLSIAEKDFSAARLAVEPVIAKQPKSAMPVLLLAKIQLAQGEATAAEASLKQAIALEPNSATAYRVLAQVYQSTNRIPEAVKNLEHLVTHNPADTNALTQLAMLRDAQKDSAGARDAYEKILAREPNSTLALNNLAYLYSEKFNELDKAYELAQRARTLQADDPRAADTLGWIQYRRGQAAAALVLLQDSATKLPDEPEVQYHFAVTCYALGREDAAKTAFERAVQKGAAGPVLEDIRRRLAILASDPNRPNAEVRTVVEQAAAQKPADVVALSRLAGWYLSERDLPKARRAAEAAFEASPKNATVLTQLARICAAQGERTQAIEHAKNARAASNNSGETTYLLGTLVYGTGDYRWANSLLREAADKAPDNPDVLFDWALAAYSVGQVSDATTAATRALQANVPFARSTEARRFLDLVAATEKPAERSTQVQQALQEDPSNVPALMASAALSESRGDWKLAEQAYEKVLARYPDFGPAQKSLTLLYAANLGDVARASAVASKARQSYPTDPDLAKAFGVIVYRQGDFARAASLLQESATTRTSDGELQYYLGMSQLQLKKRAESKRSLQRALELGIKDELAAQARKSLASSD